MKQLVHSLVAVFLFALPVAAFSGELKADDGAKGAAEIFAWHDSLPVSFQKGGLGPIVSFWAPNYTETMLETDGSRKVTDRKTAFKMLAAQMRYKGRYADSNGPGLVYVKSLTQVKDSVVVEGYWAGSWRTGEPEALQDGGVSFEGAFKATWKKQDAAWILTSFVYFIPKGEISESELDALKAGHVELKKKYLGTL